MAELPYGVILDILMRLPLKHAIRCRVLNKYFYNNISIPELSSSSNPVIFREYNGNKITIISSRLRTATLPNSVRILDSCNGIIFLRYNWSRKYYIFNPLIDGLMLVDYDTVGDNDSVALAVNIPANPSSSSFDFKIVGLHTHKLVNPVRSRLQFSVYHVPSRERKLVKRYLYWDYQGSFRSGHHRPVYAHGCLHWLGAWATAIAAFDVETERPRIMDGPLINIDAMYDPSWFGQAQGSLHFIRTDCNRKTIIVHTHNYVTQEWRVAHKIDIPDYMTSINTPELELESLEFELEFFDGQNVFCQRNKSMELDLEFFDGHNVLRQSRKLGSYMNVHDLSIGEWNNIGEVKTVYDLNCRYMQFVPTTARVSDVYLAPKRSPRLRSTLLRLQQILLGG